MKQKRNKSLQVNLNFKLSKIVSIKKFPLENKKGEENKNISVF